MTNETKSPPTAHCGMAHSPTPQEIWDGLSEADAQNIARGHKDIRNMGPDEASGLWREDLYRRQMLLTPLGRAVAEYGKGQQ